MKSKIFAVAASAFAFAFAFSAAAAVTAMPMGGVTIKAGSPSAYVMALQSNLNLCAMANPALTADGKYGPKTTAAVAAFQVANGGLTVDGKAGPMTQAALVAKCATVGTSNGGSNGGTTTLSGGAGDANLSSTSTNVENSVKEGASENVLGFKVEADGSDINVSNVKVSFANQGTGSEKFTNYVDSVSIMHGSKEVGSADASDFSRESGSPDTFSKTISLSNAVVKEGKKDTFYVVVEAAGSIDSDDITNSDWVVQLDTVRFNDATGAIISTDGDDDDTVTDDSSYDATFNFEDESGDDDLSIKSSSANPVASTLMVDADTSSDDFLVGAFKFDVDDQSSDIDLLEFPVVLTFDDSDDTVGSTADAIVDTVTVKIGGESYEADLDDDNVTDGDGTATYIVDLNDENVTVDAGDDSEVKVYVTFNEQDGNYGSGTTVVASVDGSEVDAEGADELNASGSFTGKTHTLSVDAPTFSLLSKSLTLYQAIDGVTSGEEDVFLAKFTFNVTAPENDDIYISKGVEGDADYTSSADTAMYTQLGSGNVDSAIVEADDETLDDGLTSSFLVTAGSTEKFTLSFFVRGNNGSEKFTINSFAYGTADDTSSTYDYNSVVNSGLSSFSTNTTYLAK